MITPHGLRFEVKFIGCVCYVEDNASRRVKQFIEDTIDLAVVTWCDFIIKVELNS